MVFNHYENQDDYSESFFYSKGNINKKLIAKMLPRNFGLMDSITFPPLQSEEKN